MFARDKLVTAEGVYDKCPTCGRFASPEYGFYDREEPEDECSLVVVFCDEQCADAFRVTVSNV